MEKQHLTFLFSFGIFLAVFGFKDIIQFLLANGVNTKLGTNSKSYFGEGKTACFWNARVDYLIPECSGCSGSEDCDSCIFGCNLRPKLVVRSQNSNLGYFTDHKQWSIV